MGGEVGHEAAAVSGDDEVVRRCGAGLLFGISARPSGACAGRLPGPGPAQIRAPLRRLVFGSGRPPLDQHGGEAGNDRHGLLTAQTARSFTILVAPAGTEHRAPLVHVSQHGDGGRQGGGNGGDRMSRSFTGPVHGP